MKGFLLVVTIFFAVVLVPGGGCHATPFTGSDLVVDFYGSGIDDGGRTYLELSNKAFSEGFEYTHSIDFDPMADHITSANLTISHKRNSHSNGSSEEWEVWLLSDTGEYSLGTLKNSNNRWVDQAFPLSADHFKGISGSDWTITLKLFETTNGADKIFIDKSALNGEYFPSSQGNHTPEPSTLILLGFGIVGLVGISKRKRNKKI